MRDRIKAKLARPEDGPEALRLLSETPENLLDPSVLSYPCTTLLKAANSVKTVLYVPYQGAFVMESLGINPEASETEVAEALKVIMQRIEFDAELPRVREVYFVCKEPRTEKFAGRHGFEELPWKTFRLKL